MRAHTNRRIVLALLGLVVVAGCALVLPGRRSAAVPQTASGPCCSKRIIVADAARRGGKPAASPQAQPADPPGTIDGAKNPELIPDNVAYKMLFLSIMEPENPTQEQTARQQAKLGMIGFSDNDKAAFLATLSSFRDQMNDLAAQTAGILNTTPNPPSGSAEWQQLSNIEQQVNAVVADTVETLSTGLSQDGYTKLQARLLEFKHTIKAFPMPPMPSE